LQKKTEKWSTFSSLHLKPPQTNEWMNEMVESLATIIVELICYTINFVC
jgi:hypothetical protein